MSGAGLVASLLPQGWSQTLSGIWLLPAKVAGDRGNVDGIANI